MAGEALPPPFQFVRVRTARRGTGGLSGKASSERREGCGGRLRRTGAPETGGLQQRIHLSVRLLDGTVGINDGVCAADLFIRRHLRINAALGLLAAQSVALQKRR